MPTEGEAKFRADGPGKLEALAPPGGGSLGRAALGRAGRSTRPTATWPPTRAAGRRAVGIRPGAEGTTRISLRPQRGDARIESCITDDGGRRAGDRRDCARLLAAQEARDLLESLGRGGAMAERLRVQQRRTERAVTPTAGCRSARSSSTACGSPPRHRSGDCSSWSSARPRIGGAARRSFTGWPTRCRGSWVVAEPRTKLEHALHRLHGDDDSSPAPPADASRSGCRRRGAGGVRLPGLDRGVWDPRTAADCTSSRSRHPGTGGTRAAWRRARGRGSISLLGCSQRSRWPRVRLNVGMSLARWGHTAFRGHAAVALLAVRHRPAWVGRHERPVLLLSIRAGDAASRRLEWCRWRSGLPRCAWRARGRRSGRWRSSVRDHPRLGADGAHRPAWLAAVSIGLVTVGIP